MSRPAPSKIRTPLEQARTWWSARHARGDYVVAAGENVTAPVARVLRQERLVLDVAGKRVWILTEPARTDERAILLQNYWAVVANLLRRYEPAVVIGTDAVRLMLGRFTPPESLRVSHASSQSKLAITLGAEFRVQLRPGRVSAGRVQTVRGPGGVAIPVLAPADLLCTLDASEIAYDIEAVSAWLRHLVVRAPDLDTAVEKNPRPLLLQRLADVARAAGNPSLAKHLDGISLRYTAQIVPPSRTGVGTRLVVPKILEIVPRGTGSPWTDEQLMRLDRQTGEVHQTIDAAFAERTALPVRRLLAHAAQAKSYDAYHNTTMEGYRISREVADAIVRGEPLAEGPQDRDALAAAMAVKGYSIAFDHVLELVKSAAPARAAVNRAVILDLYEDLFRPSVDAGIVEPGALRGFRTSNVSLRGWRHVPPNHLKIRDLLDGLEKFADNADLDGATRALLVHLEFVTIHPFLDGNGRLGRLLMNLSLLSAGLPWVTVRSDERIPFFRAIEHAQVDRQSTAYIEFLWNLLTQSIRDVGTAPARRGRSQRT